jgi:hypothetical protein
LVVGTQLLRLLRCHQSLQIAELARQVVLHEAETNGADPFVGILRCNQCGGVSVFVRSARVLRLYGMTTANLVPVYRPTRPNRPAPTHTPARRAA